MSTYSFLNVQASLAGPGALINLGQGAANAAEGITIARAGDRNKMVIGADGNGMNTLIADKSGQVTVRLLKTSPQNAALMAAYNAQQLSSTTWGQNVITVTQSGVGDIHTCRECAFKKVPDMNYKAEGDTVEWMFDAVKIDSVLGTY
jgi:ribosomal protein S11